MNNVNSKWAFTAIFIEDPIDKGYTAFFAEYPNVVVEGDTKEEAKEKLFAVMNTVLGYKRQQAFDHKIPINSSYTTEKFNVELEPA